MSSEPAAIARFRDAHAARGGAGEIDTAVAAARPHPIPVYAEMSSVNPVVVLPGALAQQDPAALAQAFVGSLTLGSGQFCTNPGLALVPAGEAGDAFVAEAGRRVADATGQRMLTPGIAEAYARCVADLAGADGVEQVATGSAGGEGAPAPALSVADWQRAAHVAEQEVFGASGVVVRWSDLDELLTILRGVEGQLTATVHCDAEDAGDSDESPREAEGEDSGFLQHPDERNQPRRRRRKATTPHWEDVLLGVRANTKRPKK